jgi:hypothetical protein
MYVVIRAKSGRLLGYWVSTEIDGLHRFHYVYRHPDGGRLRSVRVTRAVKSFERDVA